MTGREARFTLAKLWLCALLGVAATLLFYGACCCVLSLTQFFAQGGTWPAVGHWDAAGTHFYRAYHQGWGYGPVLTTYAVLAMTAWSCATWARRSSKA